MKNNLEGQGKVQENRARWPRSEKENKKYVGRFTAKYRAFSILQNNIEDIVKKSTLMWKLIYGLTTIKQREEDPFKGRKNGEEDEDKEEETKKKKLLWMRHRRRQKTWLQMKSNRKNRVCKTHKC